MVVSKSIHLAICRYFCKLLMLLLKDMRVYCALRTTRTHTLSFTTLCTSFCVFKKRQIFVAGQLFIILSIHYSVGLVLDSIKAISVSSNHYPLTLLSENRFFNFDIDLILSIYSLFIYRSIALCSNSLYILYNELSSCNEANTTSSASFAICIFRWYADSLVCLGDSETETISIRPLAT